MGPGPYKTATRRGASTGVSRATTLEQNLQHAEKTLKQAQENKASDSDPDPRGRHIFPESGTLPGGCEQKRPARPLTSSLTAGL